MRTNLPCHHWGWEGAEAAWEITLDKTGSSFLRIYHQNPEVLSNFA